MSDNTPTQLFLKHNKLDTCMLVKLYVENEELKQKYLQTAKVHNDKMKNDEFPDSGFDLFAPEDYSCLSDIVTKINFGVKCSASRIAWTNNTSVRSTGYYMYPRSSLSKTKIRLANSVGIIDSGYRGDLIGAFDCITKNDEYKVLKYDRLVQICSPDLSPIIVEIVDNEAELGKKTSRGSGGFGSTGI